MGKLIKSAIASHAERNRLDIVRALEIFRKIILNLEGGF